MVVGSVAEWNPAGDAPSVPLQSRTGVDHAFSREFQLESLAAATMLKISW
jgi:hypothetical protein